VSVRRLKLDVRAAASALPEPDYDSRAVDETVEAESDDEAAGEISDTEIEEAVA
jgi:hypothetical protein